MEGFQWGGGREEQGGKGTGKKKHSWQAFNRWGKVKNGIGNREFKELVCITHGHEVSVWGGAGGLRGTGWREEKGGKIGKTVIA